MNGNLQGIGAIIIGILAGWIAEKVMRSDMGLLMNIVLGIVGALSFSMGTYWDRPAAWAERTTSAGARWPSETWEWRWRSTLIMDAVAFSARRGRCPSPPRCRPGRWRAGWRRGRRS